MPDVVTCVILYEDKMLLLKRSNRVGTHKGKWACVSGYVEEGDIMCERAMKEIEEETGLFGGSVKLEKEGKPITFFDKTEGKTWTVHPFLFRSNTDIVKIDWEHTEYEWINPSEMGKYDVLPKLKEVAESLIHHQ